MIWSISDSMVILRAVGGLVVMRWAAWCPLSIPLCVGVSQGSTMVQPDGQPSRRSFHRSINQSIYHAGRSALDPQRSEK